jgi:hypothetical protein
MKILQIAKIWIVTIVIGSVLSNVVFPVMMYLNDRKPDYIAEYFFSWILFSLLFSLVFSLPTMIILISANEMMKRNWTDENKISNALIIIYLICSIITFAILFTKMVDNGLAYAVIYGVIYTVVGFWMLKKELKKAAYNIAQPPA